MTMLSTRSRTMLEWRRAAIIAEAGGMPMSPDLTAELHNIVGTLARDAAARSAARAAKRKEAA